VYLARVGYSMFIKGRNWKERSNFVSRRICENTRKCLTLRSKEALAGGDTYAQRLGTSRKITRPLFFCPRMGGTSRQSTWMCDAKPSRSVRLKRTCVT